jgi:hypothetical protein
MQENERFWRFALKLSRKTNIGIHVNILFDNQLKHAYFSHYFVANTFWPWIGY